MLNQLEPWIWRYVLTVIIGSVVYLASAYYPDGAPLQLARVVVSVGAGSMYSCALASRFFGAGGAKMFQGVFLAGFLFLVLISVGRFFGGSISIDLATVQAFGYAALILMFTIPIMGLSGLMASNYMRVPSGRSRGLREIASALSVLTGMYSGMIVQRAEWHEGVFLPLVLVCVIVVVILTAQRNS